MNAWIFIFSLLYILYVIEFLLYEKYKMLMYYNLLEI